MLTNYTGDLQTDHITTHVLDRTEKIEYHLALDNSYGVFYCLCFVFGVLGNIFSFSYFLTRRKDLPNTLYKIITLTDVATSVASLAVGISFLSGREPGVIFGEKTLCKIWTYVWHLSSRLSIFLVVVLSGSRTYYLMKPFNKQRVAPSLAIIFAYSLFQIGQTVGFQIQQHRDIRYIKPMARCVILFGKIQDKHVMLYMDMVRIVTFVLPMFIVFFSVLLSIKTTLRRVDQNVRHGSGRKELQRSRNRATVTILLFTGVYAVFNVPLVVSEILHTIDYHNDYRFDFHSFDYDKQYYLYYDNFISLLSVALNAAINPLLYLWRMPGCQNFVRKKSTPMRSFSIRKDSAISEFFAMNRLNHRLSEDKSSNQVLWSNKLQLHSCS